MAAGSIATIMRAPGRIVINPTTSFATTAYPYGGTEIGKANLCALAPLGTPFRIESEALGEATDILEGNNRYAFSCFIRGMDDDAKELMMAGGYEVGSVTQHAVWAEPGTKTPGQSTLSRAVILAYVPDDILHVDGLLIYRGIPGWSEGSELTFQRGEELGMPLTVDCLRDANANLVRIGRMADLSLT